METVCRPGDLAIVINAQNSANIGLIVRVLHRDFGCNPAMKHRGPIWTCECAQPMIWTSSRRIFLRKRGPVPDSCMRPIRGDRARLLPAVAGDVALALAEEFSV